MRARRASRSSTCSSRRRRIRASAELIELADEAPTLHLYVVDVVTTVATGRGWIRGSASGATRSRSSWRTRIDRMTRRDREPAADVRQRATVGRLNSLRRVHDEEVEHPLEVVGAGPLHEADEHRLVALDERRHAEHGPLVDRLGVLGGERLERPSAPHLRGDGVGVEAGGRDRLAQHVLVPELQALVVARREQREVRVEELVGEGVAHGDAVQQREHARAPLARLALPDRRLALLDVGLVERERQVADVEVGAAARRRDRRPRCRCRRTGSGSRT